jgi:hypothetical protein
MSSYLALKDTRFHELLRNNSVQEIRNGRIVKDGDGSFSHLMPADLEGPTPINLKAFFRWRMFSGQDYWRGECQIENTLSSTHTSWALGGTDPRSGFKPKKYRVEEIRYYINDKLVESHGPLTIHDGQWATMRAYESHLSDPQTVPLDSADYCCHPHIAALATFGFLPSLCTTPVVESAALANLNNWDASGDTKWGKMDWSSRTGTPFDRGIVHDSWGDPGDSPQYGLIDRWGQFGLRATTALRLWRGFYQFGANNIGAAGVAGACRDPLTGVMGLLPPNHWYGMYDRDSGTGPGSLRWERYKSQRPPDQAGNNRSHMPSWGAYQFMVTGEPCFLDSMRSCISHCLSDTQNVKSGNYRWQSASQQARRPWSAQFRNMMLGSTLLPTVTPYSPDYNATFSCLQHNFIKDYNIINTVTYPKHIYQVSHYLTSSRGDGTCVWQLTDLSKVTWYGAQHSWNARLYGPSYSGCTGGTNLLATLQTIFNEAMRLCATSVGVVYTGPDALESVVTHTSMAWPFRQPFRTGVYFSYTGAEGWLATGVSLFAHDDPTMWAKARYWAWVDQSWQYGAGDPGMMYAAVNSFTWPPWIGDPDAVDPNYTADLKYNPMGAPEGNKSDSWYDDMMRWSVVEAFNMGVSAYWTDPAFISALHSGPRATSWGMEYRPLGI